MINLTSDYFERFDQLLIAHSAGLQLYTSTQPPNVESVRKFVFKDLLSVEGEYQKDLADFILWILSSNDRELFFCKSCNIKFQQHPITKAEHADLAKLFIYPDSRCQVHKKNQDWARKCYILWNRYCEKNGGLSSRSGIFSTQSGNLASKSETESFHKRALSSVTEMLLPSMDETDTNALDSLSRINLHKPSNKFHSMESFYAPDIESIKDSAFSPPLIRSVITPDRRHQNEDLSALRIYLSSQPTHVDGLQLPGSTKKYDQACPAIELEGTAESKEIEEEATSTIQPPPITPVPPLYSSQDTNDRFQQSPTTPVRQLQDFIGKVPSDGESGPHNKVYVMKLYKELGDVKKQLQSEKQEKEALSAELKTVKSDAAELQEKYTKTTNDSKLMEKQTREVLQRYMHLQKSTDAEMAEMRDRLVSLKEELSQKSTVAIGSLESKSNDASGGVGEEKHSEVKNGIALCGEFETPLSISTDAGELNEIKTVYNNLFTSSRSNIEKLRTSFHELTIQHKYVGNILERTNKDTNAKGSPSSTDTTRMERDLKTMHEKYEKLQRLSKSEIHSLRSLYMEASEAYVSDLALSDVRGQEGLKIYETEMSILKAKCEILSKASNALQKQTEDHNVELEQLEKTTELENQKLRRALEKSDRELRRVQFKMDADSNLANVEIQQLKSNAQAYNEQVCMELKQQEQNLIDAKAIYATDLRTKTQSLQDTINVLRNIIGEQKKHFAEQLQAKSAQELRTKELLEQTIESLRLSIEDQKRQIEELEHSVTTAQESAAAAKEAAAAANFVVPEAQLLNIEKSSDSFSNQILEYIVPQADNQPGLATTSDDTHSLFNEYVGPQDRDGISTSPETVSDTLGTLSKSQDKSQDQLTSKNSEIDEPSTTTSMAPSLDLTRIYLRDKDKDSGEEEMVLSPASNTSAHEEFTNPLYRCSSQRLSASDFDMARFVKDHAIIVVDKSQGRETDSVFTLSTMDNESTCSKSVTYGNSLSVTIVGDPDGTDRNDDLQYSNTATSTVATTNNSKQNNRGSKPNELYTKALLKSRALSNSNIVSRMSRDSQDFSKDKEIILSSTCNDGAEDDDTKKDAKRLKRSSSSAALPVTTSLSASALPTDSQHHFFEENVPSNNPGIDLRFDEAIKIYNEDDELFGRRSSNVNSQGGGGGEEGGGEARKPEFFSDENPLFVRSRSASSYKHMDGMLSANIILPINSLASVSKPHSDGVSSITGPEDSRSLSNSIDNNGLLQPEMLTSHTRSVLQLSKVLGLSTTAVFDGELIRKKYSKDFMYKSSFIWINVSTNSIHWAKSADKASCQQSKYLLFPKNEFYVESAKPTGELKGYIKSVTPGKTTQITTTTGETLEMQITGKTSDDWGKVMRLLMM